MVVLVLKYVKPLEDVERLLPAHREWLARHYGSGKFICSGPREPRTGGVILANLANEVEAMKLVVDDPFFAEKVAEYEVIRFNPTHHDPRFAPFLGGAAS